MPTLSLRSIGMSYLIEGLDASELDVGQFLDGLGAAYGPAVGPMGDPEGPSEVALILDRKAADWSALLDRIAELIHGQGFGYVSWSEAPLARDVRATLHFHR